MKYLLTLLFRFKMATNIQTAINNYCQTCIAKNGEDNDPTIFTKLKVMLDPFEGRHDSLVLTLSVLEKVEMTSEERLAFLGLVAMPIALGYMWKPF